MSHAARERMFADEEMNVRRQIDHIRRRGHAASDVVVLLVSVNVRFPLATELVRKVAEPTFVPSADEDNEAVFSSTIGINTLGQALEGLIPDSVGTVTRPIPRGKYRCVVVLFDEVSVFDFDPPPLGTVGDA